MGTGMKIERLPNNSVKITAGSDEAVFHSQRIEFVLAPGEMCHFAHNAALGIMPIIEHIAEPSVIVERCGGVVTVKNLQSAYAPHSEPTRTTETQEKIEQIQKLIKELPTDEDRLEATGIICHHCGALNGGRCYCMRDD
jgi:hypothetical protein